MLDLSVAGMQYAQRRLGPRAKQVRWLTADVLTWQPERRYQAWHDRAVFHFLTTSRQRREYTHTLNSAADTGAVAVIGCFAPGGPEQCSGLLVARYSPAQLADELGDQWRLIGQDRQETSRRLGSFSPSPGWRCASMHDHRPPHLPARSAAATCAVRDRPGLY